MKKAERNRKAKTPSSSGRILLAFVSLMILILGGSALLRGNLNYQNWWGGVVFAPFAILIGLAGLSIVVFAPKALTGNVNKRSRIRGWPTGKARYYRNRD
jgi:hypothetical protein